MRPSIAAAAALALVLVSRALPAQESLIPELALDGKLRISLVTAVQMEKRLGQLLLVNVDGFGVTGPLAVSKEYLDMVERLQVGGVIPHYGRCTPRILRDTNTALAARARIPLLIAADIVTLCLPDGRKSTFGDGYVGGFLGRYKALDDAAFERRALFDAYALRWLGVDWLLGPTVDVSTGESRVAGRAGAVVSAMRRFGLLVTIKHWPFLPPGVDLHRQSVDTRLPLVEVRRRAAVFRDLAHLGDALMTTHVYDSLVDNQIVTLSERWIRMMKDETGWTGPVVSDGLFMLRSHRVFAKPTQPLAGLGTTPDDEIADWAARSILAGHDMVIVEGTAATSSWVYRRLLEIACRDDELGERMRSRINEAHRKILVLKARAGAPLAAALPPSEDLLDRVVGYLADRGAAGPADTAAEELEAEVRSASASLPPPMPR